MKIIKTIKRLAAAALCLFATVNLSAEITGSGTISDPFVLHTADDWNTFASNINANINADKYYKLADDWDNSESPVTTMAGTRENRFNGSFEGNGKTLTVNITTGSAEVEYTAPFRYVLSGYFSNLTVNGTIKTSIKYAAGFIGNVINKASFDNCISAVTIDSSISGDGTHGGFIGATSGGCTTINLNNCMFSGKFLGSSTNSNSGFIGWPDDSVVLNIKNCLFAPLSVTMSTSSSATFFRNPKNRTVTNSYYTQSFGTAQGSNASGMTDEQLLEALGEGWQIADEKLIPIQNNLTFSNVIVNGLRNRYDFEEGGITLDYTVLDRDGNLLEADTDYTVSIKLNGEEVTSITEEGTYTIIFAGIGDYRSSQTFTFIVKARGLTGEGTEESPFILSTVSDWNAFVTYVHDGCNSTDYYKLSDDWDNSENPVTVAVGETAEKPFSGIFDGNGKTLYINVIATANGYGLFHHIEDGTIKNLTVAGTISGNNGSSKYKILGGLAGYTHGNCLITDTTVSTTITTSYSGDSSLGGFLGEVNNGSTAFVNCIFNGSFNSSSAYYIGGFNGWLNGSACVSFTNCLFAPESVSMNTSSSYKSGSGTFSRGSNWNVIDCYYTDSSKFGNVQGLQVSATEPESGFYKIVTFGSTDYYAAGNLVLNGISSAYLYTGSEVSLDYEVIFNGKVLTESTDYTITITDSEDVVTESIVDVGTYSVNVTGTGNYQGNTSYSVRILPPIIGSGTQEDPFIISSAYNWETFAEQNNEGINSDKYYKLSDDFDNTDMPVTVTVGTEANPFKGVLDGNGKTLNVNITDTENHGTAPFRYIGYGAVIKNLTVTGTVTGTTHTAGLVGFSLTEGTSEEVRNTIENCIVSVYVNVPATSGNRHRAGVLGHGIQSYVLIKDTMFNGTVSTSGSYSSGNFFGGFQGWSDGNSLVLENCFFNSTFSSSYVRFHPLAIRNSNNTMTATSFTDCYYLKAKSNIDDSYVVSSDGIQVYTNMQTEQFNKTVTLFGTDFYEAQGTSINSLAETFNVTGSALAVPYSVTYNGTKLVKDTDFVQTIKNSSGTAVESVIDLGVYTLTVTGTGEYLGSKSVTFSVVSPLEGNGTEESPFLIKDLHDWEIFAQNISYAVNLNAHYKLTNDIGSAEEPVTFMVSTSDVVAERFAGTLDGNGKTITVAISTTATDTGLFRFTNGGTFKNLTVTGTIESTKQWIGGFVGTVHGSANFTDCISSVEITGLGTGDGTHAGFIGRNSDSTTRFTRCMFNGKLLGEESTSNAGFAGYNNGSIIYTDCLFAPAEVTMSETNSSTFNRNGRNTFVRAYCLSYFGENQGTLVSTTRSEIGLSKAMILVDGNTYYIPVDAASFKETYAYTGSDFQPSYSLQFDGNALVKDVDYTLQIVNAYGAVVDALNETGEYTITLSAAGDFIGSIVRTVTVGDVIDSALQQDTDESYYINMPQTGTVTIFTSSRLSSFKVYDNGGKNGYYSNYCDGYLVINAPAGYTLSVSGTVYTESPSYDWLTVYDGANNSASTLGGEKIAGSYSSINVPDGVVSTGSSLTLRFRTDSSRTYPGLDLTVTVIAPVSEDTYTLSFDSNGGSGTMENMSFTGLEKQNLTANAFTYEGHTFVAWNTAADGSGISYSDEAEFWRIPESDGETVTLYAQWAYPYTLAFNANGGSGTMESMSFTGNEKQALTANAFTREGCIFTGWNTQANGSGISYNDGQEFNQFITEEDVTVTLYAQWILSISANADPYTENAFYTTFYDSTVSYLADCEVYYVSSRNGGNISLVKAADNIIKAGEGVILKSIKNIVTLIPTTVETSNANGDSTNVTGTDSGRTFTAAETAESDIYVLSLGENGVRFYKVSGEINIGAHKAYIEDSLVD